MIMMGNRNKVYHNTVLVDPTTGNPTASIVIPKRAEPQKWWTPNPTLPVQNEDTLVFNNASYLLSDRGGTPTPTSDRVFQNVTLPRDLSSVFGDASDEALANGTFDLRPIPGSPLIDAGRLAPGMTQPYHGKAPDVGAYEAEGDAGAEAPTGKTNELASNSSSTGTNPPAPQRTATWIALRKWR